MLKILLGKYFWNISFRNYLMINFYHSILTIIYIYIVFLLLHISFHIIPAKLFLIFEQIFFHHPHCYPKYNIHIPIILNNVRADWAIDPAVSSWTTASSDTCSGRATQVPMLSVMAIDSKHRECFEWRLSQIGEPHRKRATYPGLTIN